LNSLTAIGLDAPTDKLIVDDPPFRAERPFVPDYTDWVKQDVVPQMYRLARKVVGWQARRLKLPLTMLEPEARHIRSALNT